jgi:hypothetical protein
MQAKQFVVGLNSDSHLHATKILKKKTKNPAKRWRVSGGFSELLV